MRRRTDQAIDTISRETPYVLDQAPRKLAATLSELAVTGAEGGLWASLSDDPRGEELTAELAILYLHAADRNAAEVFSLVSADAATRDLFFSETVQETRNQLRQLTGRDFNGFADLLEQRRSEYTRCREMVRTETATVEGTVMFAFYKHLLAHGRAGAILVMSQVQLDRVENETMNAFSEVADRLLPAVDRPRLSSFLV